MKLEIYDTTLRDGEQGAGISFGREDRIRILHELDTLGVSYIEAGMLTGEKELAYFRALEKEKTENAALAVFVNTCRAGESPLDSEAISLAKSLSFPVVTVCGKASSYHVRHILRTTPEENLRMIRETVACLAAGGKEVFFDAEHFFDGYGDDAAYALSVLETAEKAGATRLILCDTNGGNLPDVIGLSVEAAKKRVSVPLGIHCHNDLGMAEACSLAAVLSGVSHVQGTLSGIGERCGNANLCTLIPLLQLKLGMSCVTPAQLKQLSGIARHVAELSNRTFDEREPFVGGYAFTHKAGTHIDGVSKSPRSFEQIDPEDVGNMRNIVISSLSGRAAYQEKVTAYFPEISGDGEAVARVTEAVRKKEALGYTYEDAEASLLLVIKEALGGRRRFFELRRLKVTVDASETDAEYGEATMAAAFVKVAVDGKEEISAGEGVGPVNAMDTALRRALSRFYPMTEKVQLTDYKVRVISSDATASFVRVQIESTDGQSVWRTVGVSADVIDASWQALRDSVEYMLDILSGDGAECPENNRK